MDKLKVYIENRQKAVKIPTGLRLLVRRCCNATLTSENFEGNAEVNVTFVDDEQIKELNTQYRKIPESTDVLSFPMGEKGKYDKDPETDAYILGDIVISLQTAEYQAGVYSCSFQKEVSFLTIHAMLHLLGYDHEEGGLAAVKMHDKEETILGALGFNPEAFEV